MHQFKQLQENMMNDVMLDVASPTSQKKDLIVFQKDCKAFELRLCCLNYSLLAHTEASLHSVTFIYSSSQMFIRICKNMLLGVAIWHRAQMSSLLSFENNGEVTFYKGPLFMSTTKAEKQDGKITINWW